MERNPVPEVQHKANRFSRYYFRPGRVIVRLLRNSAQPVQEFMNCSPLGVSLGPAGSPSWIRPFPTSICQASRTIILRSWGQDLISSIICFLSMTSPALMPLDLKIWRISFSTCSRSSIVSSTSDGPPEPVGPTSYLELKYFCNLHCIQSSALQ